MRKGQPVVGEITNKTTGNKFLITLDNGNKIELTKEQLRQTKNSIKVRGE
jgi:hypothetical protein